MRNAFFDFICWARENSEALQGLGALTAILALAPTAGVFIWAQLARIGEIRESRFRLMQAEYKDFLSLALLHPQLRVATCKKPMDAKDLSEEQLYQRDTLFDLLTSTFETAFLMYNGSVYSWKKSQWTGWAGFIDYYFSRSDYREWWVRVMLEGDPTRGETPQAPREPITFFDAKFDRYIVERGNRAIRLYDTAMVSP